MMTLLEARQARRIEELEAELAVLRGEQVQRADQALKLRLHRAFGLPAMPAALLAILYRARGRVIARTTIDDLLPRKAHGAERELKVIDVYISRLRKVLGKDAIVLEWDFGYGLTETGVRRIDRALAAQAEVAA